MRSSTFSLLSSQITRYSATVAIVALLSACASSRGIAPSAVATDHIALHTPNNIEQSRDVWPTQTWWMDYKDPQLNQLIDHALANSPTLATARTRIAHAQAAVQYAHSSAAPQVNGSASASYGRLSANYEIPPPPLGPGGKYVGLGTVGLNFSYDLDLWGKNAALIRSANAQAKAAVFDHDAAQLALTTSIVRAYAQLAYQYETQDVLEAMLKQRQKISELTAQRVASGLDTRVEVKQAESNEAALRAELVQTATAIDVTRVQLAALTGAMPDAAQQIHRPSLAAVSLDIPQSLPFDLLGRRPELAAQRARINAAIGESDAAKAQFYPSVNLAAMVGFQSIGLGQLFSAGSYTNNIGPAISLPIFDAGRLRANYAAKTTDIDAVVTQYNQSVVSAAQEVAEQLTRAAALTREENATHESLAAAEEAYRLALLRYRAGLSPYLTVLSVETQLLTERRASADLVAKRRDVQIALIRALGGGFNETGTIATSAKN
jgi:NodT family efflux transporter outer membrane factor (OMF) lipoprotein